MEKPIIVNRNPPSFLLILLLLLISSSLASVYRKPEPSKTHQNEEIDGNSAYEEVQVGLVLDMGSLEGKTVQSCISMALSDFYRINSNYRTRVSILTRDSHGEPLLALAAAVDLLQGTKVEAIIGAQSLFEAKLLAEIGEKAKIPVISLHVSSSLSFNKYSHFIQATHDEISEAKGITAFVQSFGWRSVVLIYADDDDWRDSMQQLVEHFQENGIHIVYKSAVAVSSSEDYIMEQLQKFRVSETMVFVVHMSQILVSRLFPCAGRLGMMEEGYAWFLTAKTMNHFWYTDYLVKESMEGVVGFKSYIPIIKELHNFTLRWRKSSHMDEDGMGTKELSVFGIWAHDIAWTLARAAELARERGPATYDHGSNFDNTRNTRASSNVSALLEAVTQIRLQGLSGDVQFINKKFVTDTFEVMNIVGTGERRVGLWDSGSFRNKRRHLSSANELGTIIWPGGSAITPKGRSLRENGKKKLRVLVTSSNRFPRLMEVHTDPETGETTAKGFCIEVFETAIGPFNYELEYIPWHNGSNYDNLAYAVYSQKDKYDAAVGDITISANRSMYVDFTLPFTDMGFGVVAPKDKSMWIFLRPLSLGLWLTSAAFFILTGILVWLIERPVNPDFQGSASQQIGMILWFGFSTLVYAHRDTLQKNSSRFIVTVWVFAVVILTSSYTATLTSMMTVEQIRYKSNQDFVGHLSGSLIAGMVLTNSSLRASRSRGFNTSDDYAKAMLNGSVSFVIDEMPYLKDLLVEHPTDFLMVKTETSSNGFGIMFQKGSWLAHNVSQEIAKLRSTERLKDIENRWFQKKLPNTTIDPSNPLDLYRFRGLFMIIGVSFALALIIFLILWLKEKSQVLKKLFIIYFIGRLELLRTFFARAIHPMPSTTADIHIRETENVVQMVQPT